MSKTTLEILDGGGSADRLTNRQQVRIARLGCTDYDAVVAMLGRCSALTLQQRFHGITNGVQYVTRLLGHATNGVGYGAWLASRCVGVASLHFVNETGAEMAALVEDTWQQRGIGSALVAEIVRHARWRGLSSLRADVHGDNHFIPPALARLGPTRTSISGGVYTMWLDLEPTVAGTEGIA